MPAVDVLDEKLKNLEQRVESHDVRHSASVAELWGEIGTIRGELVEQKIFKAQVKMTIVILAGVGSVIGSLLFAIGKALLAHQ